LLVIYARDKRRALLKSKQDIRQDVGSVVANQEAVEACARPSGDDNISQSPHIALPVTSSAATIFGLVKSSGNPSIENLDEMRRRSTREGEEREARHAVTR